MNMHTAFIAHRSRLLLGAIVATLAVVGCVTAPLAPVPPPKLVVFMAIDGLPQRQVVDYRDQLAPDGLRRFLDRGAWFADAHYGHALTRTAPRPRDDADRAPTRIAPGSSRNEWSDPHHRRSSSTTPATRGTPTSATRPRSSTARARRTSRVETVGDVLRQRDPRSKVIAISGKDRGAILPAGKTGIGLHVQAADRPLRLQHLLHAASIRTG